MKTNVSIETLSSVYDVNSLEDMLEEIKRKTLQELKKMNKATVKFIEKKEQEFKSVEIISISDAFLTLESADESRISYSTKIMLVRTITFKTTEQ